MAEGTCCSYRGPEFDSQILYWVACNYQQLQLQGIQDPILDWMGTCTHIHIPTHNQMIKIKKNLKKEIV